MNMIKYLEERQHGYSAFRKSQNDWIIERLGTINHEDRNDDYGFNGFTHICKFSKNKNNLHVIGCIKNDGRFYIAKTIDHDTLRVELLAKYYIGKIYTFAWAEPDMKIVVPGKNFIKICDINPNGSIAGMTTFCSSLFDNVMFCPGSSDKFCAVSQDSTITLWDGRVNNGRSTIYLPYQISNAHGLYTYRERNMFQISSIVFKDSEHVITCSGLDDTIKLWDLRMCYKHIKGNVEPIPLTKYKDIDSSRSKNCILGYKEIITNPNCTHLYASGIDNIIDCYLLDSPNDSPVKKPIHHYTGHNHATLFNSRISISNDGRYLLSACKNENGVIWVTDFPHNEKPMFVMENKIPTASGINEELSNSDWCADPATPFKLITCSNAMPNIWNILTSEQIEVADMQCSKTSTYKKLPMKKKYTLPIKLDAKLKEQYDKETEENMINWDLQEKNLIRMVDIQKKITNMPQEDLLSNSSPISSQVQFKRDITDNTLEHPSLSVSHQISDVVTPMPSKKNEN